MISMLKALVLVDGNTTYGSVGGLLLLVPLLVGGSLGFIRSLLLLAESLPLLTEDFADLAYRNNVSNAGSKTSIERRSDKAT
jgi:hypothetical protein